MRSTFLPFALPDTDETEIDEIAEAVRSGWVTTGPKTRRRPCTLRLEAIGLQAGDEVILQRLRPD